MSIFIPDEARRVIPRWRESFVSISQGELEPAQATTTEPGVNRARGLANLDELIGTFQGSRSVAVAAEIISSAYVLREFARARDAAEFVLMHAEAADRVIASIARRITGAEPDGEPIGLALLLAAAPDGESEAAATIGRRIAATKVRVGRDFRNSYAWSDLARLYASVGQRAKARQAMVAAASLAPNDRFVVRSAVRFFVHAREPEYARDLLRRSGSVARDPWLLAADVAVATLMDRSSRLIARARNLLKAGDFPPHHLSELAAAVGTVEAIEGKRVRATRLFSQALVEPTENAVAQAEFMRVSGMLNEAAATVVLNDAHEAHAWRALSEGAYEASLKSTWEWHRDEPFSSRAAALGSATAGVALEDANAARLIGEAGLLAKPGHPTLLNNVAFALGDAGRVQDAEEIRSMLPAGTKLEGSEAVAWRATDGLLAFRRGDAAAGRDHYAAAFGLAKAQTNEMLAVQVLTFWTAEELRARTPDVAAMDRLLAERVGELPRRDPFTAMSLSRLERIRARA